MQNTDERRSLSDPGNIILILILVLTVLLALHGKTIVLVPRYREVEIQSDAGDQWKLDDKVNFEKLDNVNLYADPKQNPEWQPPCLPNEAPGYEEKMKEKIEENLKDTNMEVIVETLEDEFKKATKDLKKEN